MCVVGLFFVLHNFDAVLPSPIQLQPFLLLIAPRLAVPGAGGLAASPWLAARSLELLDHIFFFFS